MSTSRLRPYLGPVIALLVVLALGAGTVYAAIPNGNGSYYACYVKNTGAVKLINYPKVKTCKAGEKLIKWSAKGPAGPAGPVGPVGPQGPAGAAGITKITISYEESAATSIAPGEQGNATAVCPAGKVIGGGLTTTSKLVVANDSFPRGTGWVAFATNNDTVSRDLRAVAVCMTTDPSAVIAKTSSFKASKKNK